MHAEKRITRAETQEVDRKTEIRGMMWKRVGFKETFEARVPLRGRLFAELGMTEGVLGHVSFDGVSIIPDVSCAGRFLSRIFSVSRLFLAIFDPLGRFR
jgi:hypothetical protein